MQSSTPSSHPKDSGLDGNYAHNRVLKAEARLAVHALRRDAFAAFWAGLARAAQRAFAGGKPNAPRRLEA